MSPAASIRARVRAEMTDEIKTVARRHLAEDGANLSLRAVARELGMASSAVYRYFASRDDLLTALIVDAYDALGAAAETAEGTVERANLPARWLATCHAVRDWAVTNPHEYALIYGSPVPGYRAPQDTIEPATRIPRLVGALLQDATGEPAAVPESLIADLARATEVVAPGAPPPLMAAGIAMWTHLFGAVSFELFGQYTNVIEDKRAFFEYQMRLAAAPLLGHQPLSEE